MSSPQVNKRREMDVMKLLMSDWSVELVNDSTKEFEVDFQGPVESPYEGGMWKVRVELPDEYPYKSPSIGFKNRIYHPNVDESAGSVCLDVINQTWSPLFDLVNVFEVFLPQLLLYPNPSDPLNGEAAALMLRDPEAYKSKIREYVRRHAMSGEALACSPPRPSACGKIAPAAPSGLARTAVATVAANVPSADACSEPAAQGSAAMSDGADELMGLLSDSDDEA